MAADTYSVPVIFKGGPIGGEVKALPYKELRFDYQVAVHAPLTTPHYASEALPLPRVNFETEAYRWQGERGGDGEYIMRWQSPVRGLRKTIEELKDENERLRGRERIRELDEEVREKQRELSRLRQEFEH